MKKSYKLTITQEGPKAEKDFINVIEGEDAEALAMNLARCYRDLNRTERASAIKSAKHWVESLYDEEKKTHHFVIKYDVFSDHSRLSVYHWEFKGLGDAI